MKTPSTATPLAATGNFCDKSFSREKFSVTFGRRLGKDSGVVLELSQSPYEPPEELVRRLSQLQLCRPADFRRARASVRRLSRDLPPFDSVWIDALTQLRTLTPYQARLLEQGDANQLLVEGHVVVELLGHGARARTVLAKGPKGERVVLKRITVDAASPELRQRLGKLIERTRGWAHPSLVVPHRVIVGQDNQLIAISRHVPGLTLSELLIRRGRIPATMVLEIARQLAQGLAAFHRQGLVHGDLQLSNVRLSTTGQVSLVDGGIRPAICPELTIHETLALDAYDGVAPELIGTGIEANGSSEIYALGCLLTHLLTGRPPYSMADPLMKLAAHQTQRIADVRMLAPDTPAFFAESIYAMTSPVVNQRPRSCDDLLQRWGRSGLSARSSLKKYRKRFDGAVPHFVVEGGRVVESRWPWIAALLFVGAGMALTFADSGLRSEMLAITQRVTDAINSQKNSPENTSASAGSGQPSADVRTSMGLLPLPAASADGEILLSEQGPYDVARVAAVGKLTIRGAAGVKPVIQVGSESLWLGASSVKLENLTVVCSPSIDKPPKAMVLVQSQQLIIHDCVFQRATSDEPTNGHASAVVGWGPSASDAATGGIEPWHFDIKNTVFHAPGAALWAAELPHRVVLSNCLKLGTGVCIAVSPKATPHPGTMDLKKLTLRDSGPLLRLAGAYAEQAHAPTIELIAQDCVFALAETSSGLVELQSAQPRGDKATAVHMSGEGSVLVPQIHLMTTVDSAQDSARQAHPVEDADDQFEGIMVSELSFAGPIKGPASNSQLKTLTAPRSAAAVKPGVDVSHLPVTSWK